MTIQSSNKSSGSQLMANYVTGKVTTIEQARKANVPTLNGLTRKAQGSMTYTRAEVVRQIAKWLIELNELMDLKKPMNKGQIITCAEMILADYTLFETHRHSAVFHIPGQRQIRSDV